jgi:hypothetical protein
MTTQNTNPVAATAASSNDIARELEQLSQLATLVTAARDAMSDELVNRLASTLSEGIAMIDRLTRNDGMMRLLQVLDRPEIQHYLFGMADALSQMSREVAAAPPLKGGVVGLLRLARQPGTLEGLRSISLLGQYWGESLRELHRRGG